MADFAQQVSSQVQQTQEFFKKFADPQAFTKLVDQAAVKKFFEEQTARLQAAADEASKLESKLLENANRAVDESVKLVKESLAQAASLSAEYRRLSLEATKQLSSWLAARN